MLCFQFYHILFNMYNIHLYPHLFLEYELIVKSAKQQQNIGPQTDRLPDQPHVRSFNNETTEC